MIPTPRSASSRPRATVLRMPLQVPPPGPLSGLALPAPGEEEEERLRAALVLGRDEEAFGDGEKFQEENVAEPLGVTRAAHLPSPVEAQEDPATWHGEWWAAVEAGVLEAAVDTARAAAVGAGSGDEDEEEDDVRGSVVNGGEEEDDVRASGVHRKGEDVAAHVASVAADTTRTEEDDVRSSGLHGDEEEDVAAHVASVAADTIGTAAGEASAAAHTAGAAANIPKVSVRDGCLFLTVENDMSLIIVSDRAFVISSLPKQPGRKEAENSEKCKLPLFTFQFVAMVLREGSFCHVYKVDLVNMLS
ncbi:hypothetical protein EJB05_30303, partial [Eragrostis curvula]